MRKSKKLCQKRSGIIISISKKGQKYLTGAKGLKKTTTLKCILFGKLFIILGYIHTFKVLSKE